jgi:hypothetical protein
LGEAVISALKRAYANFRGFDEAGSTVPMMDGPLKPNTLLDSAPILLALPAVDNLLVTPAGLLCSSGAELISLRRAAEAGLAAATRRSLPAAVTCLASDGGAGVAVGLDGRGLLIQGGRHDGRMIEAVGGGPLNCPTAALFQGPDRLLVANGSAAVPAAAWKRDLMSWGASGSVWRVDLSGPRPETVPLAEGLAFPCGLAPAGGNALLVSEAWRHRLLRLGLDGGGREGAGLAATVLGDLPAYPGRLTAARDGGYWLALFAPRNQLVEFVLREHGYRRRMLARIDPDYWIAPSLSSGASYFEPIQGGARKKLNIMKPWAPTWSYGLLLRCDAQGGPRASFHSRADGHVHGVTSVAELDGRLLVGAKGSGVIASLDIPAANGGRAA